MTCQECGYNKKIMEYQTSIPLNIDYDRPSLEQSLALSELDEYISSEEAGYKCPSCQDFRPIKK
jgi:hypothetical protein